MSQIFINAQIFTSVEGDNSLLPAMLVENELVVLVGSEQEARARVSPLMHAQHLLTTVGITNAYRH
jgi:predicted amidohydrolase YtcJ